MWVYTSLEISWNSIIKPQGSPQFLGSPNVHKMTSNYWPDSNLFVVYFPLSTTQSSHEKGIPVVGLAILLQRHTIFLNWNSSRGELFALCIDRIHSYPRQHSSFPYGVNSNPLELFHITKNRRRGGWTPPYCILGLYLNWGRNQTSNIWLVDSSWGGHKVNKRP